MHECKKGMKLCFLFKMQDEYMFTCKKGEKRFFPFYIARERVHLRKRDLTSFV